MYSWKFCSGFCPAGFLPAAGNRGRAFCLFGKTGAQRGLAPGINRVRARRGEEKDTVRDLLGAAALLAGLTALRAANRRQVRETLEKPRSKAQLFKRFCALGTRRSFFPARETRSSGCPCTRNQPRACETRGRKDPVRDLPTAGVGFCPAAGNRNQAFSLPGKTEARCGPTPGTSRVRARRGEEKDTVRDLLGAAARLAHRRCARRSRAPGTSRVRARLGAGTNPVRDLPAAGARLARRSRATCSPQARAFSPPGKQEPCVGAHPEPAACVRGWAKEQTGCATCSAQPRELLTAGVQVVI